MVCHSLLQWTTFCQTSPPWPACLGWPHMAWLSFIALDKAVVHVIRLTSFLCYGFSVSALWCPLATPTILLEFLLPWTWGISSPPPLLTLNVKYLLLALLQLCSHRSLDLGLLLPAAAPNFGRGLAPLGSSCTVAAWHSLPPPLTSDVG